MSVDDLTNAMSYRCCCRVAAHHADIVDCDHGAVLAQFRGVPVPGPSSDVRVNRGQSCFRNGISAEGNCFATTVPVLVSCQDLEVSCNGGRHEEESFE